MVECVVVAAAKIAPFSAKELVPDAAVMLPPHVLDALGIEAIFKPEGKVSETVVAKVCKL